MRNMSKYGMAVSKVSKKAVAIAIAFAMSLPGSAAYANVPSEGGYESEYLSEQENEFIVSSGEHLQEIIDEAEALGVPNAFIRHYFASELADEKIEAFDGMADVINETGADGLEIKDVKLTKLAKSKIDLGVFDFGEYKAGNLVYNFLASKKLKGTAKLFVDDATEPICEFKIKRGSDDPWSATKSLAVDVRKANLTGNGKHLYLQFIPDAVLNEDGTINEDAKGEGSLYLESMFFTEGSTAVLNFDIDDEINTVESINGSETHTTMGYGTMNVQVPEGYKSPVSGETLEDESYELDYIRGRGNSTWLMSKKPYKIKLDKKSSVLGMAENKHWALLANYFDYTLLRNRYTFYLAEQLGMKYTPHSVAVDVVMDGEYYGSYQLSESIRIDENRIDIDNLEDDPQSEEPGVTGGYLLQHMASWLSGEELPRVGYGDTKLVIDTPEYKDNYDQEAKDAQIDYISRYLETIDNAVAATKKTDSETTEESEMAVGNADEDVAEVPAWRDVLDEDSLIKYTLIQDFTMNGDAYSGSTYYYKPRNDKLYCGPVWDFDFVAWGAYQTNFEYPFGKEAAETLATEAQEYAVGEASEEVLEEPEVGEGLQGFYNANSAPWFMDLYENDEEFKENVISTWNEFSAILKDSAKDGGVLDQMAKETYMSALANYQVSSSYLIDGVSYWGEGDIPMVDDDGNKYTLNYYNEINRLKNFVNHRASWVDANISEMNEYGGSYALDNVEFYVDGELYATAALDDYGFINPNDVPADPVKEGYVFKGWYHINQEGEEEKLNVNNFQVSYEWGASDDWYPIGMHVKNYYAKFVLPSEIVDITSINFIRDTVYVPLESYEYYDDEDFFAWNVDEEDNDGPMVYYDEVFFDAKKLLKVLPFDAELEDITFEEVDKDGNPIAINKEFDNSEEEYVPSVGYVGLEGDVEIWYVGEMYVKASYKDQSAILKVVAHDSKESVVPTKLSAEKEINLNVGEYGDVNVKFDTEDYVPYYYYSNISYLSLDENVVEVGTCGQVKAKAAGETTVVSCTEIDEVMYVAATKVVVNDPSKSDNKDDNNDEKKAPVKGTKLTDKTFIYTVTKAASDDGKTAGEVAVKSLLKKTLKKANIKATVTIDGYKYKVTSVANKAFKGAKKLKNVTIGKNVKKIGAKAFFKLKKLTKVTIKSKKLPKIGNKAFVKKGKKITIKVNAKLKKKAKKALKKAKCKGVKVK